jgi:hypothetical protein
LNGKKSKRKTGDQIIGAGKGISSISNPYKMLDESTISNKTHNSSDYKQERKMGQISRIEEESMGMTLSMGEDRTPKTDKQDALDKQLANPQ